MPFVDDKQKKIYKHKILKYLIEMRNLGLTSKYHMYDMIDPEATLYRKNQFIVAVLVTVDEILTENISVLNLFEKHVMTKVTPCFVSNRVIQHDRCAFVMNASTKYFHEHGECRLFDPGRKILFKLIDSEYEARGAENGFKKRKSYKSNPSDQKLFHNMNDSFERTFNSRQKAVLLLYSHYIPCTVPFHECAKLLREFVKDSGRDTVVGYEEDYKFTDQTESHKWLSEANITVFSGLQIRQEMERQYKPLFPDSIENWGDIEQDCWYYNTADDLVDSYPNRRYLNKKHISKHVKKHTCKIILNKYLEETGS